MTCGVYEIQCGPYFYQGSSKDVERRFHQHRLKLRRGKHANPKFQDVFNKYGWTGERILMECVDEVLRLQLEQELIDANFGDSLYLNINPFAATPNNGGGKNKGRVHTAEHRANNAAARLGSKHSEETKAKMSATRTGKVLGPKSEETKAKISAAKKGSQHTEATKAKMRESHAKRLSNRINPA